LRKKREGEEGGKRSELTVRRATERGLKHCLIPFIHILGVASQFVSESAVIKTALRMVAQTSDF
jgi:hypothetical protein